VQRFPFCVGAAAGVDVRGDDRSGPGKPGTLLCRASLGTGHAPFNASGSSKPVSVWWRRRRTIRSRASRSVSSVGPFAATLVVASNLSAGSGVVVIFFSLAHLTASAPFRAGPPGSVSGQLSETTRLEGLAIASRFPVVFRLPAFASRSSDSRQGVGLSLRSAYRTRDRARTRTGLPRSARTSYDRGGSPLYPEDGGARPGQVVSLTGACRFTAASPYTPPSHPIERGSLHEASTGVQAIDPSGHSPRL
jgi:hypothetical protein